MSEDATFEGVGWIRNPYDDDSAWEFRECSICFALVRDTRAEDHAAWHDGDRGRVALMARRLLPLLNYEIPILAAAVARQRDTGDWTLLLGLDPPQAHAYVYERMEEIAKAEGAPFRIGDVSIVPATNVRWASDGGEISFGDVVFTDAVRVFGEEGL